MAIMKCMGGGVGCRTYPAGGAFSLTDRVSNELGQKSARKKVKIRKRGALDVACERHNYLVAPMGKMMCCWLGCPLAPGACVDVLIWDCEMPQRTKGNFK